MLPTLGRVLASKLGNHKANNMSLLKNMAKSLTIKGAALALLVLSACTAQRDFELGSPPVVIYNDGGGQLISAEADRLKLLQSGVAVEIRGYCASACVSSSPPA